MAGYEWTIISTRCGSIERTGFGCPRCYRVRLGSVGELASPERVDLATAFGLLAAQCTRS